MHSPLIFCIPQKKLFGQMISLEKLFFSEEPVFRKFEAESIFKKS
jgi:hypothetical protein